MQFLDQQRGGSGSDENKARNIIAPIIDRTYHGPQYPCGNDHRLSVIYYNFIVITQDARSGQSRERASMTVRAIMSLRVGVTAVFGLLPGDGEGRSSIRSQHTHTHTVCCLRAIASCLTILPFRACVALSSDRLRRLPTRFICLGTSRMCALSRQDRCSTCPPAVNTCAVMRTCE